MPSYWLSKFDYESYICDININRDYQNNSYFECEPCELKPTVKLKNIYKKFSNGLKHKNAVQNLTINFYQNQITGLLGHNGAGKVVLL